LKRHLKRTKSLEPKYSQEEEEDEDSGADYDGLEFNEIQHNKETVIPTATLMCFYNNYNAEYPIVGNFQVQGIEKRGVKADFKIYVDDKVVFSRRAFRGRFYVEASPSQFVYFCYSSPVPNLRFVIDWQYQVKKNERSNNELSKRQQYLQRLEQTILKLVKDNADKMSKSSNVREQLSGTEKHILWVTSVTQLLIFWNVIYFLYSFFQMFKQRIVC